MAGFEAFLMLLAILAVGAILAVPVFLLSMMAKLLRRQEEAERRTSADFKDLQIHLREQQRLLRQILDREPAVKPEQPTAPEPVTPAVEIFTAEAVETRQEEPEIAAAAVSTVTDPVQPAAAAELPTAVRAYAPERR